MNKGLIKKIAALSLVCITLPAPSYAYESEQYSKNQENSIELKNSTKAADANQIISFAKKQLGKPYVWGASGPNSFDCSGFIYYVFNQNGYNISRTTVAGYWSSSNIKKISKPTKGDIIFFKGTYGGANNPSHIGIMISDNEFIHASSDGKVQIDNMNSSYWKNHFLGYGRLISTNEDGWHFINNNWYYYINSQMQTGWKQLGDAWYYFNDSGHMQTGWQQLGDIWYYFNDSGHMQTGWQQLEGTWYYFSDRGHMQTGWQQLGDIWYYFNDGGHMQTGWQQLEGTWYYFNDKGHMQTGWQQLEGTWYYFNDGGHMQTGLFQLNSNKYFANNSGHIQTGWQFINNNWYYFYPDSFAMATNTVIGGWQIDSNGVATPLNGTLSDSPID